MNRIITAQEFRELKKQLFPDHIKGIKPWVDNIPKTTKPKPRKGSVFTHSYVDKYGVYTVITARSHKQLQEKINALVETPVIGVPSIATKKTNRHIRSQAKLKLANKVSKHEPCGRTTHVRHKKLTAQAKQARAHWKVMSSDALYFQQKKAI